MKHATPFLPFEGTPPPDADWHYRAKPHTCNAHIDGGTPCPLPAHWQFRENNAFYCSLHADQLAANARITGTRVHT